MWLMGHSPTSREANAMFALPSFATEKADIAHKNLGPLRAMCGRLRVGKDFFTSQHWSVQPCVRPVSAAHRAAGHNALRGSGPGQKHAFKDAVAHVGCPDRRIDRLCITCCLPFPTFTSRPYRRDPFRPRVRPVPCSVRLSPSSPKPSAQACWPARWRRPWLAAAPTMP